ncbi:Ribulose-5-phosphate 4-epimerase/Fuculose-1-phosphate aldolase [Burkholderia sp. YR290]|jgi:L-fuculose-phosphate aldolase|uniref:aldolase n=1 Tax=Paraburkholderia hospita TaxID=169430 RepID=UPI0009A8A61F|nr:aldolase [Paraburkholderia hospita]SKC97088.1 Ribulose-5-phosphate 4-epimerase/Fuculose-1-phosphate aldolase [Paraburkholderia hospita]SOE90048.1 Ribulose-5-phosphate 4-epimerase/Fuculose-1-phosphate aldolase [Burkholderia sp. YR290]
MNEHDRELNDGLAAKMDRKLEQGAWDARQNIALACRMLAHEGHSETLAGQITVRESDGTFLTTAMAYGFDEATRSNVIRIDDEMNVIEGRGMANPAIRFHLWIYRRRPDVNCIVHTHPPYVNALSMTGRPLEVAHMDATPFHDDCAFLREWPGLPIGDSEGEIISTALGNKRVILLANHGFLAATSSLEESAYLSVLIERAARSQILAQSVGELQPIDAARAKESHDFLLLPSIVKSSFALFARRVIKRESDVLF